MSDKILAIKRSITCVRILQNYVNLKKSGSDFFLCHCPFCQTDTPARAKPKFWIHARKDVCNCFRPKCAAPKPMDVINLYARLENITNADAIRALYALVCTTGADPE